ncbi:MAG: hypothetical protein F4W89_01270 [Acidobacteria bacterium]|nr:hypothetical protein [Acidobacteriota bacterium]
MDPYALGAQVVIAILMGIGMVWAIHVSLGRELHADVQNLIRQVAQFSERMARIEGRLACVDEHLAPRADTPTSSPASDQVP